MSPLYKLPLVIGVGFLALPACPLVDVQVDAPDVCLHYPNLQVPAAMGQTSLKQSFVFDDLSAVHNLTDKLDADLEFVSAKITATSGVSDFSFVQAVHLSVSSADPGSTLPTMTMYDCDGDCDPNGASLEIPAAVGNNAIAYLESNSIKIDLDFEGQAPSVAWTMDVDVCVKASAGYSLQP